MRDINKRNLKASRILSDQTAISTVIGFVLMTAITAIMGVVILNWSSGIDTPETPLNINVHINREDQFNGTITIISINPPGTEIQSITIVNETKVLTAENEPLHGFGTGATSPGGDRVSVGDTQTTSIFGKFDEHMVIVADLPDGSTTIFNAAI